MQTPRSSSNEQLSGTVRRTSFRRATFCLITLALTLLLSITALPLSSPAAPEFAKDDPSGEPPVVDERAGDAGTAGDTSGVVGAGDEVKSAGERALAALSEYGMPPASSELDWLPMGLYQAFGHSMWYAYMMAEQFPVGLRPGNRVVENPYWPWLKGEVFRAINRTGATHVFHKVGHEAYLALELYPDVFAPSVSISTLPGDDLSQPGGVDRDPANDWLRRFEHRWDDNGTPQDTTDDPTWTIPYSFNDIIKRFAINAHDPKYAGGRWTSAENAKPYLDRMIDYAERVYGDTPGASHYYVLDEGYGWNGLNGEPIDDDISMLIEYVVARIREWDGDRPIVQMNWYGHLRRQVREGKVYAHVLDDMFRAGEDGEMQGWNVWMEEIYAFNMSDRYSQLWTGPRYYRDLYYEYVKYARELSDRVVTEVVPQWQAGAIAGPMPEWWILFSAHMFTEWVVDDGDPGTRVREEDPVVGLERYYLRFPLQHEYKLQAYLGLASGARGVEAYRYPSSSQVMSVLGDDRGRLRVNTGLSGYGPSRANVNGEVPWDEVAPHHFQPLSEATGVSAWSMWDVDEDGSWKEYEMAVAAGDSVPEAVYRELYPYDEVSALFADLQELLPVMRGLRWWWTVEGTDLTVEDKVGGSETRAMRYAVADWLDPEVTPENGLYVTRDGQRNLGQRFGLRALTGDDERDDGYNYGTNAVVGLFTKPGEADTEYYFVVNMRANVSGAKGVGPATESDVFTLEFDSPGEVELVWENGDDPEVTQRALRVNKDGDRMTVEVELAPGEARLVRVR